jgi:REP element-mobilizing transposase RayT
MARALRIEYPGAFHHVISRGYQKMNIFLDAADFMRFEADLQEVFYSHSLIIHAKCLMSNHFHLFTETPFANLQKAMHKLLSRYSAYFKSKYKHRGKVFEQRYKAFLVDSELYALDLVRYIHRNPMGVLVDDPLSWHYSSYKNYQLDCAKPIYLETQMVLERFDRDINKARKKMKDHMYRNESSSWFPEDFILGKAILGNKEFLDRIKDKLPSKYNAEFTGLMQLKSELKIPSIKKFVSGINVDMRTKVNLLIYAFHKKTSLNNLEINKLLGLNLRSSSITSRLFNLKEKSKKDMKLAKYLIDIEQL